MSGFPDEVYARINCFGLGAWMDDLLARFDGDRLTSKLEAGRALGFASLGVSVTLGCVSERFAGPETRDRIRRRVTGPSRHAAGAC